MIAGAEDGGRRRWSKRYSTRIDLGVAVGGSVEVVVENWRGVR
jgi:hypothetical protein